MAEQLLSAQLTEQSVRGVHEAVTLIEQALDIVDSAGLTIAAARLDQALAALRFEIDRQG